ncbi:MAG: cell division protein ZapA [Proteobacteria bacterium]|nr:cell division protein ZapA [Pseudomonadota bacterium]MDE3207593.1 cell division protein ZapA [Pseudomonadota bacterium]
MIENQDLTVLVMGREFRISCPENEREALLASVDMLNSRMLDIKKAGGVPGNERVAILAALQIAHEFYSRKVSKSLDVAEIQSKIKAMQGNLDSVIDELQAGL